MGLRKKLSVLSFSITIISILVTAILGFYFSYTQARQNIDESMAYESELIISEINRWLDKKIGTIDLTARIIENNDYSKTEIKNLLSKINEDPEISDVYMGFEDGGFISSIDWIPPQNYDPRTRPWYINALSAESVAFSEPYLDMTTGKLAVSIGVISKNKNSQLIGIIAEDILVDTILQKMSQVKFKNDGYAFIINSSGYLLAHPDETLKNTDLTTNPELKDMINQMRTMKSGKLEYSYKGIDKRTIFKEIDSSKWIVGITIPRQSIYKSLNSLIFQFIIIFIAISYFSIFFANRLSKNIVNRIHKLLNQTVTISKGNYQESIEIEGDDEITDLSHSFNSMVENIHEYVVQLDEYNDTLESRVEEATRKIESTQKQLMESEKIASLSYLVNGIAHEMNTPIGNCITLVSYIQSENKGFGKLLSEERVRKADLTRYVEIIQESSTRLMTNLETSRDLIFNFKKLSAYKFSTPTESFNMERCFKDSYTFIKAEFPDLSSNLIYESPHPIVIRGEKGKFEQVFMELIQNSFIHGFSGGKDGSIHIRVTKESDVVHIAYSDNGIHLDDEVIKNIFIPFYTTKFSNEHNGLGMSLVYNLVQSMNGDIRVHSHQDEGVFIEINIKL